MTTTAQAHDCNVHDRFEGMAHVHCTVEVLADESQPFGNTTPCNEMLTVQQDGEGPTEWIVDPLQGARCAACREPVCSRHLRSNTPSGRRLCQPCAAAEVADALGRDELFRTAQRAAEELRDCLTRMRAEPDARRVRELVPHLQEVEDVMAEFGRELFPFDRARRLKGAA